MATDELKHKITKEQTWRHSLKVDDYVDVYFQSDEKRKVVEWVTGQIGHIDGDLIDIKLLFNAPEYDVQINRFSTDLAEHHSMTKEDAEWREANIGPGIEGFVCDVNDKYHWEEATIFKTRTRT
jgi:hypothetical protein